MNIDRELTSEYTVILNQNEEEIIHVQGTGSLLTFSLDIVDSTAKCTIQSAIESRAYVELDDTLVTDILWEDASDASGTTTAEFIADVLSSSAIAPSFIKIKNTSTTADKLVRINFRLNRA